MFPNKQSRRLFDLKLTSNEPGFLTRSICVWVSKLHRQVVNSASSLLLCRQQTPNLLTGVRQISYERSLKMQPFLTYRWFKTVCGVLLQLRVGTSVRGHKAELSGLSHTTTEGMARGNPTAQSALGHTLNIRRIPDQDTLYPQEAAQRG